MSCLEHCRVTNGFLHFSSEKTSFEVAEKTCRDEYGGRLAAVKDATEWREIQENCCVNSTVTEPRDYFFGINYCTFEGTYNWVDEVACKDVSPLVEPTIPLAFDCANVLVDPTRVLPSGYPAATVTNCTEAGENYFICQSSVYVPPTTTTVVQPVAGSKELSSASAPLLITLIALAVLLTVLIVLAFVFRKRISALMGGRKKKTYELDDHKEKESSRDEGGLKLDMVHDHQLEYVVCNTNAKQAATPASPPPDRPAPTAAGKE